MTDSQTTAATSLRWMATNHPGVLTDTERVLALTDRITRALTALDAYMLGATPDPALVHKAWAILSEGRVPESVRNCPACEGTRNMRGGFGGERNEFTCPVCKPRRASESVRYAVPAGGEVA